MPNKWHVIAHTFLYPTVFSPQLLVIYSGFLVAFFVAFLVAFPFFSLIVSLFSSLLRV